MSDKKPRTPAPKPQDCPNCGNSPTVRHKGTRWWVRCSTYVDIFSSCQLSGHQMLTKREAVEEWNKLVANK
jgi:ssDNA-binding Zn-finger/Zn-ribbon topoisomerase 1